MGSTKNTFAFQDDDMNFRICAESQDGEVLITCTDLWDSISVTLSEEKAHDFASKVIEMCKRNEKPVCHHENRYPERKWCRCSDCGSVLTDSGWGIASRMWFNSPSEAEFYRINGRFPE